MIVHTSDDQCTVGADGTCTECGATHAAPCPNCNGAAYHRPGCVYGEAAELAVAVLAVDLTDPRVWPVLDPARGVATSVSRAALVAMPREELAALMGQPWPTPRAAECACGFPATRSIHTGGENCPRGERTAIAPIMTADDWSSLVEPSPVRVESVRRFDAATGAEVDDARELLEIATVHGFGHADVTMTSQVTISSPPVDPSAAASVDLRVFVRERDQRRDRLVLSHLHELAAAVLRATVDAAWPVEVVLAGDCRLPSGYVGRVRVELDSADQRGAALAALRAMHELGSRPW